MAMDKAIKDFAKQFKYRPKIEGGKVKKYKKYIVAGMGGSHLAGDILADLLLEKDIVVWPDYPPEKIKFSKTLIIASSYSGNTEEALEWLEKCVAQGQPVAAMATGGKMIELAQAKAVPFIQIPTTGIQPRSGLGFSMMAMLKLMKLNDTIKSARGLAKDLLPAEFESQGKEIAEKIRGKYPVIYASMRNYSVAYNWKIKFNETGKIPSHFNVFPELNHNEMTGYDVKDNTKELSEKVIFIMINDSEDHPQNKKRMEVTGKLYKDRGLQVENLELTGATRMEKIFRSLILADWTAFYTGQGYGLETEQVPMVEEFKKLIE